MWKNSWSSADAASRSVCDWGLKGLILDERSGPVSQVQPTPQPFLKLQELFVFMWSGQINEVKWRSLLSGLCWNGFGVRCRCTWFLGCWEAAVVHSCSIPLLPLRKEMDTQLSGNFQGHTVKLWKCFGTPRQLLLLACSFGVPSGFKAQHSEP